MEIINKGNYFILDTGKEQYSIPKGQVVITQDGDTVTIRLTASRKILAAFKGDAKELISLLF